MKKETKVVILAAGKGTRMLPLTNDIPKVLVEVNGRPFLYYLLKNLEKAGYQNFALIVGHKKEKVIEFLEKENIKAEIIEQKNHKGGTGDAVLCAKDFAGKDNFIVLNGDNLWSVKDLENFDKNDNYNYIGAMEVSNPERYGVLIEKNGFLEEIKEKPKEYVGNLINTGLYRFIPEIFEALEKVGLSPRGEHELTDAIVLLAKEKKVKIEKIKDSWKDLGSLSDIEPMSEFLKNNWE